MDKSQWPASLSAQRQVGEGRFGAGLSVAVSVSARRAWPFAGRYSWLRQRSVLSLLLSPSSWPVAAVPTASAAMATANVPAARCVISSARVGIVPNNAPPTRTATPTARPVDAVRSAVWAQPAISPAPAGTAFRRVLAVKAAQRAALAVAAPPILGSRSQFRLVFGESSLLGSKGFRW